MNALYRLSFKALPSVFAILVIAGSQLVVANSFPESFALRDSTSLEKSDAVEQKLMDMVNKERRDQKLNGLIWDAKLAQLARYYSEKMAQENFFSHYDSKGNNLVSRAKDFKINWTGISENLYFCKGFDDPLEAAVSGWLKSPPHRANLLNKLWSSTGIGVAESSDGKFYVTQVFLRR